jgi:hypothetical protein
MKNGLLRDNELVKLDIDGVFKCDSSMIGKRDLPHTDSGRQLQGNQCHLVISPSHLLKASPPSLPGLIKNGAEGPKVITFTQLNLVRRH